MAKQQGLRELLMDELRDVYDAEKQLTKALPKMAKGATSEELREAIETHLQETEGHVERLERVFEAMGETARGKHCDGIAGIINEGAALLKSTFDGAVLDAGLIAGAQRAEHYEIAAYTGLVSQARALKEREAVDLLQENLKQEKEALKKVETISKRLLKKATGNGRTARP